MKVLDAKRIYHPDYEFNKLYRLDQINLVS
jgi:hypothetical protein